MDEQPEPHVLEVGPLLTLVKGIEAKVEALLARPTNHVEQGYLSLKNAAFYSDLSQKTLRRFIAKGELVDYRPARGKILIKRKELDALIQKSTTKIRRGRGIR